MNLLTYGTLRRFHHNHKAQGLEDGAKYLKTLRLTNFTLYNVGWFPGVRFDQAGHGVLCELFQITDRSLLRYLDQYEGYNPADERGSLFIRRNVRFSGTTEAYIYIYVGDKTGEVIEHGDFEQWQKQQQ